MPDRNRCEVRPGGREGRKGEGRLTRGPSQSERRFGPERLQ